MSAEDDRHTLQRFVAGLDVDADALATAITGRALDQTIVDEALLKGLASDETVVRRRAARRIARMTHVSPRVAARLTVLAGTDAAERVREAAAAALRAHEAPGGGPEPKRRPPRLAALRLEAVRLRSGDVSFGPSLRSEAPYASATLRVVGGVVSLEVSGLPPDFAGTRPAIVVLDEELARAAAAVSADGDVTIRFASEAGPLETLEARLREFDLVVFDD